jgi:hypothetical protein
MTYQDLTQDEYRILMEALQAYKLSLEDELHRWGGNSTNMSGEEVEIQSDIEDSERLLGYIKYETIVNKEE